MKKLSQKIMVFSFAFAPFISAPTFAISHDAHMVMQTNAAGCMSCHQNEIITSGETMEKKADSSRHSSRISVAEIKSGKKS